MADEKRLGLDGCPHCGKSSLALGAVKQVPYGADGEPSWRLYKCQNCGGIVPAWSREPGAPYQAPATALTMFPLTGPQAQTDPSQPTPAVQRVVSDAATIRRFAID